ncbi:MAG TPA: endonuclease/exonuclease/phosphatase family protein [Bacteroidia bacterium]|nr:endonuclease/exonuclease/phosphatase family protein [Bacteroidia bacterium]
MSFFRKVIFFFNLLAIGALMLCYMNPHVSPAKFWPLAFLGLAYPAVYIINIFFFLFWLLRKSILLLFSAITLSFGFFHFNTIYQFRWQDKVSKTKENSIKVMSFNVRLFDLYNWTKNKTTRQAIFDFIKKENPDIIAFQEFYADEDNEFIQVDSLKSLLNLPYNDYEFTLTLRKKHHWGIATYSKCRIIGSGHVNFREKSNNICIYSDMLINHDTVRVYNMHLQSIHLLKEDYKFIDALGNDSVDVDEYKGSRKIAGRLKRAFIKRAEQVDSVSKSIKNSPYPVIVCGDFNDTPASYTYQTMTSNLKDSFVGAGKGWGKTYIGIFPSYRIDYILHSNSFEAYEYTTHQEKLSDHYAISCRLTNLKSLE